MDIPAELSALGAGLSQHARLVTLVSAQEHSLPQSLMAEQISGREAVNELFLFDVDALSLSTDLDLAVFIGEELTIGLLQPDGSRRAWHGLCTQAVWQGADGGVARYRLRLEPALALLTHRRDSYIFQDKNVQEIVSELLADYPQVRFSFDVTQQMMKHAVVTQYRESDFAFMTRILANEGLNWRFEHDQPGDEDESDGHAKHRVIFFDSAAKAPPTPGDSRTRFHGVRATDTDDAIDEFRASRAAQVNAVSISSWDPDQLYARSTQDESHLDAGNLPVLGIYDGSGERIASDDKEMHGELMLRALEGTNKQFHGAGAVRRLAAGYGLELTQHERFDEGENRFTVLSVEHRARNNFDSKVTGVVHAIEGGTYRNSFACARDAVPLVPCLMGARLERTALGPQTALVVGLQNTLLTTTRDHRVKVQFAWQRGACANPGGMAHDTDAAGCAPGDESSGTWVRVAEALAGPNWGSQFTPRIGTEVLVDFIEGDIDWPLIVAQLYTGNDLPPFSAGVGSVANHAGSISGFHSQNFDRAGFNQWQVDDTAGQLRTRLATSTAGTQLSLGYLIAQAPISAQRGSYRGSGFELRTDAWGVVRGGAGVLVSTSTRPQQGSSVISTQMDSAEALMRLKSAHELAEALSETATRQRSGTSQAALAESAKLISQVDPAKNGKHQGHDAFKPASGTRDIDRSQPVEAYGSAVVLMDSAASVNWATPASTAIFAGEQIAWTTQSDLHMTAQHTSSSVAANAASLFTHAGGIQAIAANGPVSLQANTDQLEILADKSITVISVNESLEIKASKRIVVQAGRSSVTLDGSDITFACPGNFTVRAGLQAFGGGARSEAAFAALPDSTAALFQRKIQLVDRDSSEPLSEAPYFVRLDDGVVLYGTTDKDGYTEVPHSQEKQMAKVFTGHAALIKIAELNGKA